MSAGAIKEQLSKQPFEAFRVVLSNGDAYEVRHPEMALLVRGVEQERERHLEHVGDFDRIGHDRERRLDPADDRRDAVAGDSRSPGIGFVNVIRRYSLQRLATLCHFSTMIAS